VGQAQNGAPVAPVAPVWPDVTVTRRRALEVGPTSFDTSYCRPDEDAPIYSGTRATPVIEAAMHSWRQRPVSKCCRHCCVGADAKSTRFVGRRRESGDPGPRPQLLSYAQLFVDSAGHQVLGRLGQSYVGANSLMNLFRTFNGLACYFSTRQLPNSHLIIITSPLAH
jgi:hypothetical protein